MLRAGGGADRQAGGRAVAEELHGLETTTPPRSGAVSFLLSPRVTARWANGRLRRLAAGRGLRDPAPRTAGTPSSRGPADWGPAASRCTVHPASDAGSEAEAGVGSDGWNRRFSKGLLGLTWVCSAHVPTPGATMARLAQPFPSMKSPS